MKYLLDTSILIAASVQSHKNHIPALDWLKKAKANEIEAFVSSHSILETYSVLTRAPFQPRITPEQAGNIITTNILPIVKLVSISENDYIQLIMDLSNNHLAGGVVYDGLILYAAHKHSISHILTSNKKDFERLANELEFDVKTVVV